MIFFQSVLIKIKWIPSVNFENFSQLHFLKKLFDTGKFLCWTLKTYFIILGWDEYYQYYICWVLLVHITFLYFHTFEKNLLYDIHSRNIFNSSYDFLRLPQIPTEIPPWIFLQKFSCRNNFSNNSSQNSHRNSFTDFFFNLPNIHGNGIEITPGISIEVPLLTF